MRGMNSGARPRRDGRRRAACGAIAAAVAVAVSLTMTSVPAAMGAERGDVVEMTPALKEKIQKKIDAFQSEFSIAGVSVAVVTPDPKDPSGSTPVTTTFSVGTPTIGSSEVVDVSTQFEIASETKIFTADLLAHLVATGAVSLDDPIVDFAPPLTPVPVWVDPVTHEETPITLRDLATHQAGLTDMPPNIDDGCGLVHPDCENPRPGYTQTMLWDALSMQPLLWQPGTNWLYSNWGFGLLGTILANVVDPSIPVDDPPAYHAALRSTFLESLGMSSTPLGTGPRIATPYTTDNQVTYHWDDTNAMAGEGGLVSDTTDMARFVAAHLGYLAPDAPAGVRSMADTLVPRSAITTECFEPDDCQPQEFGMGLGWQLYSATSTAMGEPMGVDWAFKNGGTAGFSSDTTLVPTKGIGVTTMWNQNRVGGAEPGVELLRLILAEKPEPAHDAGHHEHEKEHEARLADTGRPAPSPVWPVGAAALLLAGGLFLLRRRARGSVERR